jgi:pilus assembly protein CpaC
MSRRIQAIIALFGLAMAFGAGAFAPSGARAADEGVSITEAGSEATRAARVGLNKSLIIDLPRPARDVLVSNPEIADAVVRTQRRSFLIGRKVGQTNVFFFDIEGRQILSLELEVVHDVAALAATFRRLLPNSAIQADGVGDSIVLSGTASNATDAERAVKITRQFIEDNDGRRVVNMIGISGKEQVALKVTVAEMQRTTLKQLGVNLNAAATAGATVFNLTSFNPFTVTNSAPTSNLGFDYLNSGTSCLSLVGNTDCAAGILRALERNGLVRTLAEPTLTSISGETASFLAGGEFPVPVGRDRDGNITLEFKPFGVRLAFTPIVLNEGRISLKVGTEVSELTNDNALVTSGFTIPGLKVRRSESTIELASGGSLLLAGLIQEDSKQELNGFPGLKNLPILGALFRSREFQSSETELVVIATPYLVDPVSRGELALPDEGYAQPSDVEVTFMGRLNAVYGMRTGTRPRGSYQGDVGFIVK